MRRDDASGSGGWLPLWQQCRDLFKPANSKPASAPSRATGKRRMPRPASVDLLGDASAPRVARRDCTTCANSIPLRDDLCDAHVYCGARPIAGQPSTAPVARRFELRDAARGCANGPDLWTFADREPRK